MARNPCGKQTDPIAALVTSLFCLVLSAPDARSQDLQESIETLLGDHVGAAVMVIDRGKVVFKQGYGVTSIDHGQPVTPATNFRLASVSKQFTATAVLLLVDRGELKLDDKLADFFPGAPGYWKQITVRHLLQHRSGLPDYGDLIPGGTSLQLHDLNALQLLIDTEKPRFAPGERFEYSNSGYVLLGLIVESVADQPFQNFMRAEVFAPSGMNDTVMHVRGLNTVPRRALGHERNGDGQWAVNDQSRTSALRGDGVIYSSLNDLARWTQTLNRGRLLSPRAHEAMVTPTHGDGYGFGWRINRYQEHRRVYHNGVTRGFSLALHRFPDRHAAVVVLLNRGDTPGLPAMTRLCEQIADLTLFAPRAPR